MKILHSFAALCALTLLLSSCNGSAPALPETFNTAHRGCWLPGYVPENSVDGVRMAARYGYPAIECDVKYTSDSVMVIMHDNTINRTMRTADGYAEIGEPVAVKDTPFEELRTRYVLASSDPELRKPIPTLEEELLACKQYGVIAMLHSEVEESYELAQKILGDDGWIAFSGSEKALRRAREVSDCLILLDPGEDSAEQTIARLQGIGGRCGMSTMRYNMLDSTYIATVRAAGFEVQASIFPARQAARAFKDKVTIELSDFWWQQVEGRTPALEKICRPGALASGETASVSGNQLEFSAVTVEVKASGALKLNLNGREYTLDQAGSGSPVSGFFTTRLYDCAPQLDVTAVSDAVIEEIRLVQYEI